MPFSQFNRQQLKRHGVATARYIKEIICLLPTQSFLIALTLLFILSQLPTLDEVPATAPALQNDLADDLDITDLTATDKPNPPPTIPLRIPAPTIKIKSLTVTAAPITTSVAVAPPPATPPPWLEYRIKRGDYFGKILRSLNARDNLLDYLLNQKLKSYKRLRVGSTIYFRLDPSGNLSELLYKTSPDYYLRANIDQNGNPQATETPPKLTATTSQVVATITHSLFQAAEDAQMPDIAIDALITQMESQIDLHRRVYKGDKFRVIYDVWKDEDGEILKMGNLYAFEYIAAQNNKTVAQGLRRAKDGNYFNAEGETLSRAFLPSPLKFSRISSRFTYRRFHPVLKRWRPHRGVDYAAPRGTPVRATADGTIIRARRERGYGNVIMIKHFGIYTTVYAHLRKFAKNIKKGKTVKQGQVIGYVGSTGLSTGPHLHYEFRIRDVHKDPLSVQVPKKVPPLKGQELTDFQAEVAPLLAQLNTLN